MITNKKINRNTIHRKKIFEYLKSVHNHPTAKQVYLQIKKIIPTITLATVYRNLSILSDKGKILKLNSNLNESHFDAHVEFHQHFICNSCGKIIDIFHEEISKYALKKISLEKLNVEDVQITYFGKCNECM